MKVFDYIYKKTKCDLHAPRPTSKGSVDLTGAKVFLTDTAGQRRFVDLVERFAKDSMLTWDSQPIRYHVCIRILLRSITYLYSVWCQRSCVAPDTLLKYEHNISLVRTAWVALTWKPTVWVHWVCCHSAYYLRLHSTIHSFTSIPTEYRHQDRLFFISIL